jgi:preprotein translocase subunit SecA
MNIQRETIYGQRKRILEGVDLRQTIMDYLHKTVQEQIDEFCADGVPPSEWDTNALFLSLNEILPIEHYARPEDLVKKKRDELADHLDAIVERTYQDKEQEVGEATMRDIERYIALQLINSKWMDHLEAMDYLQDGIHLRGYAQQDPLTAYKKEAYEVFMEMQHSVQDDMVRWVYRVQVAQPQQQRQRHYYNVVEGGAGDGSAQASDGGARRIAPRKADGGKVGPNDPCPCGSGKKFKKCCMGKL